MTAPRALLSPKVLEDMIKTAPRTSEELQRFTGFSRSAVRNRLERLEMDGVIYHERIKINRGAGYCLIWRYGHSPVTSPKDEPKQKFLKGEKPKQQTVRQYGVIGRCDELVAYFFGRVGNEAQKA